MKLLQLAVFGMLGLIVVSTLTAVAAGNSVPGTRAMDQSQPVSLDGRKPAACSGIYLTNLVTGSGTLTGTPGNDLILGSPEADTIDGLGGNDCIVGGGGDDLLTGGEGADICVGGPGTNTFQDCEGQID